MPGTLQKASSTVRGDSRRYGGIVSEQSDAAKDLREPAGRPDPEHVNAISVRTTRRDELLRRLEGRDDDVLQEIGSGNVDDRNELAAQEQYRLEHETHERETEANEGEGHR